MSPAGFEPAIPASEWPQTHALDRNATGILPFVSEYKNTPVIKRMHTNWGLRNRSKALAGRCTYSTMRLPHLQVLHARHVVGNTGALCASGSQARQIQVGLVYGERMALRKGFFLLSRLFSAVGVVLRQCILIFILIFLL